MHRVGLAGGDQVKHAGLLLAADGVGGPAHQGAVVHLRLGHVVSKGAGAANLDQVLLQSAQQIFIFFKK